MFNKRIYGFIRRYSLLFALETTIAVLLSYYACYWLSFLYHFPIPKAAGLWGSISSILVIYAINDDSFKAARIRIVGSLVGTVMACIFLYIFNYNIFAFACAIFFTVIFISAIKLKETFRTACISLAVVIIVGSMTQPQLSPWLNAATRLLESIVGVGITVFIVLCFYPVRKYLNFFNPQL